MDKFDGKMVEALGEILAQMLEVRQQYRRMIEEMSQTIEAIQKNDRGLAGQKGERFFNVAEQISADGGDGGEFLKATNLGLTSQVVAIRGFLADLDRWLEMLV